MDNRMPLSQGRAALEKTQGSWCWTSAAFPCTAQPTLPSAMATEERNSTPRNAKPQPKPKANRAGGQQGRVSMRYVTACCVLLNSKHLATERTVSKTLIFLQLINCPASRLALPLRLSTRGRETGSNRREGVPVCDREVLSHHIWDYCIPQGDAKYSLPPSIFFGGWGLG